MEIMSTDVEPTPPKPDRRDILKTAASLIDGDRQRSYGDFGKQMVDVAFMFNAMTDKQLGPDDIAKVLLCLKLKRLHTSKDTDSEVDLCGYAALYAEAFK